MNIFDIFVPWIVLAVVVYLLMQVQRFILRHLFGVGFLISRGRGPATMIFYLVLLPGIIMHEVSRYLVAGMFRIIPTHVTFTPEEQADGTFDLGFVQFGFILNPVYRAIIDLIPLFVGIFAVIVIGGAALGFPEFIESLRTLDIYIITEAFNRLVSRPDFLLWSYILFGIVNTMMPTRKEARGLWLPMAVLVGIVGIFAVFGIWTAVTRLMLGPVAAAIYGLAAVFGIVLFVDVIGAVILWSIEKLLNVITRREVQYAPPAPKAVKAQKPRPKSVFELPLPLPPLPGKPGYKARSLTTTLPVPANEVRPDVTTPDQPPTVERPQRPALGEPAPIPAAAPAASAPPRPAASTGGTAGSPSFRPTNEPMRPAASSSTGPSPSAVPGTPRLNPSNPPAPSSGSGSNLPATAGSRAPAPPPLKSPVPVAPRPSPQSAPKLKNDDDVIEGEVVDDDDDDELKYEPLDE